ncbi:hypothetical protein IF2G_09398 [Cordyceps javanica]|nr:hypothetical protein IF2G_09398 [Cordyceps javanica]
MPCRVQLLSRLETTRKLGQANGPSIWLLNGSTFRNRNGTRNGAPQIVMGSRILHSLGVRGGGRCLDADAFRSTWYSVVG